MSRCLVLAILMEEPLELGDESGACGLGDALLESLEGGGCGDWRPTPSEPGPLLFLLDTARTATLANPAPAKPATRRTGGEGAPATELAVIAVVAEDVVDDGVGVDEVTSDVVVVDVVLGLVFTVVVFVNAVVVSGTVVVVTGNGTRIADKVLDPPSPSVIVVV